MIYIVKADRYVAAVIKGTVDLAEWMNKVPSNILEYLVVEPQPHILNWPVVIVEYEYFGNRSFTSSDNPEKFRKDLTNMGRDVLATYTVTENFYGDPQSPGMDYMGILDHEHHGEEDEVEMDKL